jgi:catechol-2,3-dioxygenase
LSAGLESPATAVPEDKMAAEPQRYDREAEDLGNIVMLEHVNLQVPDQAQATAFYISGLGLTRDPYMNTGLANMWVNVGKSQFHLPSGEPWVLRGAIGLVTPEREALLKRLDSIRKPLAGTKFAVEEGNDGVAVTCPWGNLFRLHTPGEGRFGPLSLGMPYLEFAVPVGAADGIARFYRAIFGAQTWMEGDGAGKTAHVGVGHKQELRFRETPGDPPPYDGHHIQVYVQNFSGPYKELLRREVLTEESNAYQYRFEHIVDVDTNETLFEIEHEIRSMTHPLYARPLVNRNPAQSQQSYQLDGDAWNWHTRVGNPRLPGVPPIDTPRAQALKARRAARAARGM